MKFGMLRSVGVRAAIGNHTGNARAAGEWRLLLKNLSVSSCSLESDKKPEESEQCKEKEQERGLAAWLYPPIFCKSCRGHVL